MSVLKYTDCSNTQSLGVRGTGDITAGSTKLSTKTKWVVGFTSLPPLQCHGIGIWQDTRACRRTWEKSILSKLERRTILWLTAKMLKATRTWQSEILVCRLAGKRGKHSFSREASCKEKCVYKRHRCYTKCNYVDSLGWAGVQYRDRIKHLT